MKYWLVPYCTLGLGERERWLMGSIGFLQWSSCSEVRTAVLLSFGAVVTAGRDSDTHLEPLKPNAA